MQSCNSVKVAEVICQFAGGIAKVLSDIGAGGLLPDVDKRREIAKDVVAKMDDSHVVALWMVLSAASQATWKLAFPVKKSKRQILVIKSLLESMTAEINKELSLYE